MTAAVDDFETFSGGMLGPATHAFTVTPHDSNELTHVTRAIYVGGVGDIILVTSDGDTVTFKAVPVGTVLPVRAKIIKSTNTTASLMLGLY